MGYATKEKAAEANKKWREKNGAAVNARKRERYANDPEYRESLQAKRRADKVKISQQRSAIYHADVEASRAKEREYQSGRRDKRNATRRAWRKSRGDIERQKNAEYARKHRIENLNYRLRVLLANRLNDALKNNRKSSPTLELIGCSLEYLASHLSAQFLPGMTWENWSKFGWHIDHVLPCASFDLSDPEQQKKCFHFSNLQPLWWHDNIAKGDKIILDGKSI